MTEKVQTEVRATDERVNAAKTANARIMAKRIAGGLVEESRQTPMTESFMLEQAVMRTLTEVQCLKPADEALVREIQAGFELSANLNTEGAAHANGKQ